MCGNTFAHMLSDKRGNTSNPRDAMFWLCMQRKSSPLFRDWSSVLKNWIPIKNEEQAWAFCGEHLLNKANIRGRGCMDICKLRHKEAVISLARIVSFRLAPVSCCRRNITLSTSNLEMTAGNGRWN